MAQEDVDMQNPFPDEWDIAQPGYGVGPAPGYQSGDYYDPGPLAAYSVASHLQGYLPDTSVEVTFNDYAIDDADAAHPSLAFGFLHYLPPAAISRKYYALQDPNVYLADEPGTSSHVLLPPPTTTTDSESSPATPNPYPDVAMTVTPFPAPKVELEDEQPPMASLGATPPRPSPLDSESDVLVTPTPTPTPTASPAYHQDVHFQPHEGWPLTPSGPPDCAHPVLPKQRRNRDDPGGDAGRLAQVCAGSEDQTGVGMPSYVAPGAGGLYEYDQEITAQGEVQQQQQEAVVVPSQWKLGTVLDRLRFPQYGGDWDALMAAVHGEDYQGCMGPRSNSPLSAEELAQLEQLRVGFGLSGPTHWPTTPITPTTPATDDENLKIWVYSPMTARRIPVTAGPTGPVLQLGAVPPSARRTHKRGAVAACAFCRRRKIACGGPQEGDEARRCGQCIQRQQPCEFPGTPSYPHPRPVLLSGPPFGYAHPAHRVGDAPR